MHATSTDRRPPLAYLLLVPFFLSGAAALIAQLCWLRQLTVTLGGSSAALNIILITFMGGLAAGARLARASLPKVRRYLTLYGLLELGLSVYLLASPFVIGAVGALFAQLLPLLGHETFVGNSVRLIVAGVALAPPTIAMGLTTPILITASVRELRQTGAHAGLLYGINTLGAATGCLIAGTWLILTFGVSTSIQVAAAANAVSATIALGLARFVERPGQLATPASTTRVGPGSRGEPGILWRYVAIAGAAGFAAMALEVVFARLMTFLIGSSYVSQTISITGFLLGIVLGSLVVSGLARVALPRDGALPFLLCGFGFAAVSSGLMFERLPMVLQRVLVDDKLFNLSPIAIKLVAALALVVLPAMLSGMLLPYVIHLLTQRERDVSQSSSNVLFFNTLGSVFGVALTGYVLIESIGVMRSLFAMSMLVFLLAIVVVPVRKLGASVAAGIGLLAGGVLFATKGGEPLIVHSVVFQRVYERAGDVDVLFYEEDESASVSVVTVPETGGRRLLINGLSAADLQEGDFALGATTDVAMLSHPDPKTVYVAGIGSGKNAGVAGIYPDAVVDAVEISQGVIDSLSYFDPYTYDLSTNPAVNRIHGDARHFLDATDTKYDVIIPDVFISALTGTAYLYNLEFFELCDRRLAPGGRVVMNVGVTSTIDNVIASTFLAAFDYVEMVRPPYDNGAYYYLIGSNRPIEYPQRPWDDLTAPDLSERMRELGFTRYESLADFRIATDDRLRANLSGGAISTDDHPVVDYIQVLGPLMW